jgi:nucleotide-binding universal stress UspA family protein
MKPSLILHPVSYSASGRSALAMVLALARWYQADLHVLELRGGRRKDPIVRAFPSADVEPHFAEFVESVGSFGGRINAVEIAGDDVQAVISYAKQSSADLVVVASESGPDHPCWRSTAYSQDLARRLLCPTLAVPAAHDARSMRLYEAAPFERILCATDLSVASANAVEHASSWARETGAKLTLLHVQEDVPYESSSSVERKLRERRSPGIRLVTQVYPFESSGIDTIVARGVVDQSIVETASRIASDLVVVGRAEPGAMNRAGMESTAAAVLRTASCPVLVVPAHRADRVVVPLGTVSWAAEATLSR